MATYYVSPTGNDSANGTTPGTAWLTVSKVNGTAFNPGDVIIFQRNGIWREQLVVPTSGTAGNVISFGAYGVGAAPVLTLATVIATSWTSIGSNRWTTPLTTQPTQIFFDGTRGSLVASQAAVTATRNWFWAANVLTVFSTSSPASAFVAPGIETDNGGNTGAFSAYDKDYITITDLHCTKSAYGFWLAGPGSNIVIASCAADYCAYDGIIVSGIVTSTVAGCASSNNLRHGLSVVAGATGCGITGGTYSANAPNSDPMASSGAGVAFYQSTNCSVSGATTFGNTYGIKAFDPATTSIAISANLSYSNTTFNIDLDYAGAGCIVDGNECYGSGTHEIAVEGTTPGAIVRNNYLHDGAVLTGAAAIEISAAPDALVYGNRIARTQNGIALFFNPLRAALYNNTILNVTDAAITLAVGNDALSGVNIRNNIAQGVGSYFIDVYTFTLTGLVCDYNCWSSPGKGFRYNNAALSFAAWRTTLVADKHSMLKNPRLTSTLALKSSSQCINAGVSIANVTSVPFPDMGAVQRAAGVAATVAAPVWTAPTWAPPHIH